MPPPCETEGQAGHQHDLPRWPAPPVSLGHWGLRRGCGLGGAPCADAPDWPAAPLCSAVVPSGGTASAGASATFCPNVAEVGSSPAAPSPQYWSPLRGTPRPLPRVPRPGGAAPARLARPDPRHAAAAAAHSPVALEGGKGGEHGGWGMGAGAPEISSAGAQNGHQGMRVCGRGGSGSWWQFVCVPEGGGRQVPGHTHEGSAACPQPVLTCTPTV